MRNEWRKVISFEGRGRQESWGMGQGGEEAVKGTGQELGRQETGARDRGTGQELGRQETEARRRGAGQGGGGQSSAVGGHENVS